MPIRSIVVVAGLLICSCQHRGSAKPAKPKIAPTLASLQDNLAAERAMIVAALAHPVALAQKVVEALESPTMRAATAKNGQDVSALMTAEGRTKSWGFDPASLEGWKSIGIDASAGIAASVLTSPWRLVIAVQVDDRSRLIAFLNARSGKNQSSFSIKESKDGAATLLLGEKSLARWEQVAGLTWVTIANAGDLATAPKRQGEQPALASSAEYQRLEAEGELQAQLRFMPSAVPQDLHEELKLQPGEVRRYVEGAVWALDGFQSRSRLLLGDKGLAGFRGIFGPDRAPPKVAGRVLNDDHIALRLRLNLATILDGVLALSPEVSKQQAAVQLGNARGALMLAGNASKLGWPGLAEAINGDVTIAYPAAQLEAAGKGEKVGLTGLVAILGGNAPEPVAKMLEGLGPILARQFRAEPLTIAGQSAFALAVRPGITVHMMAVNDGLVLAPDRASLERFLALPAAVPSGGMAEPQLIYGYHASAPETVAPNQPASPPKTIKVRGSASLVGKEVIDHQPALVATAGLGLVAMIAIPNFIRFACRAKQSEAKANLQALFVAQKSYLAEYDEYADLKTVGFDPEPGNRYTYCMTPSDCLPCTGQCYGVSLDEAKAACVKAGVMRSGAEATDKQFVGCAVGRLLADGELDVWTIDSNRRLNHQHNVCR